MLTKYVTVKCYTVFALKVLTMLEKLAKKFIELVWQNLPKMSNLGRN